MRAPPLTTPRGPQLGGRGLTTPSNITITDTTRNAAGRISVMQKSPWHSTKSDVYHVCSNCNTGNNIEKENLKTGTGGKAMCSECRQLINRGGC